jgi:hypothetical protein
VIVFDTSYLVVMLQEKFPPVKDRSNKSVPKARERIKYLVEQLSANNSIIIIPTPVLAEIMVRAGKAGPEYLDKLSNSSKFRLTSFDVRAAIEAAEIIRKVKDEQSGQPIDTWAKVKFDIQIVSIAKAENSAIIYSDDPGIENHGRRAGIQVRRICDLQLPPEPEQTTQSLFQGLEEQDEED